MKEVIPEIAKWAGMDNATEKVGRTRITPSPLTKSISIFLFATWDAYVRTRLKRKEETAASHSQRLVQEVHPRFHLQALSSPRHH